MTDNGLGVKTPSADYRRDDVDGAYLVGGGTHPGSGLPVIFESARISSRLELEDPGLEPWRSGDDQEITKEVLTT